MRKEAGHTLIVREILAPMPHPRPAPAPILTFETYHKRSAETHTETVWLRHRLARLDGVIAVALIVAALAARAPFILKGETLLHSDEAIVGLMAQDIAAGRSLPIYFYGQRYMGSLEAFVIAAISPLFDNPIHALRTGPACFFALMVAVQFLMLTRWFGRAGGAIGAAALICGSPMFLQWSISARGAYIEILLWGSLLLWSYTEWFVQTRARTTPRSNDEESETDATSQGRLGTRRLSFNSDRTKQAIFGMLIGSGLWLNPAIVLFIVPIIIHALLNKPLQTVASHPISRSLYDRTTGFLGHASLPVVALAAVLALNLTWAVWVADHKVHSVLLLGIVSKPIAGLILCASVLAAAYSINRRTQVFETCRAIALRNTAMIIGAVIGAAPAVAYTVLAAVGVRPLDPSLPLGFRPIWMTGETMIYLLNGLPLLFGADPRPFLQLVGVGRDTVTQPLGIMDSAMVVAANWMVAGCALSAALLLIREERGGLSRLLRLRPDCHSPVILLLGGVACGVGLYLLGGCTLDFTTIRYLIPLWAFVPGLLAAVFVSSRSRLAGRVVPILMCGAWALGQFAMNSQLGAEHPLRAVATQLTERGVDPVVAEPLDAHLLSYLTQQKCRTIEFESFWPRLGRYHPLLEKEAPADYVVHTAELDRTWDWIRGGWPGEAPPETRRFLWPKLRRVVRDDPARVVSRTPLPDGYELIRVSPCLNDRIIFRPKPGERPRRTSAVIP